MFLTPVVNIIQTIVNKKSSAIQQSATVYNWEEIEAAYKNEQLITGYFEYKAQKGYIIRFGDVLAFSPRFQFDLCEYDEVPEKFYHKPIDFTILKLDMDRRQLLVSRLDAVQLTRFEELSNLQKGDVLEGKVTAIMSKLITVDLLGLTCLVNKDEISWERFKHPSEVISVGELVQVKLLRVVPAKAYLSASIKQLDDSCWEDFIASHQVGSEVNVTISNVSDFGYFVTYSNNLSGMLHWSELSWRPKNKQQVMSHQCGDVLRVKVSSLDFEKQQVSFSLKAMIKNPVEQVFEDYEVGDLITGVIRSRTDFGLFIEIAENFNGLLHFSNLSWFTNSKNNLVNFRVGSNLECKIIEMDDINERVGLGLKQLTDNPFYHHPSIQSLSKPLEFPRPVTIAVSSFFQANCHNQVAEQLTDIQYKMRQHIDLKIDNIYFEEEGAELPDILVILLSDDYLGSENPALLQKLLANEEVVPPVIIPIIAEAIELGKDNYLAQLPCLPADSKPLQQWRVKSAFWSSINKSLVKSIRYTAGLK